MRAILFVLVALMSALQLPGATLERLSLDDMSRKSTDIVRARVAGSRAAFRGSLIYTFYSINVLDRWKGAPTPDMEVAVPGGSAGNLRQTFSGSPALAPGGEYVLFLWTGPSGVTHIIGLSQGIFDVKAGDGGAQMAMRAASGGLMLDPATRRSVQDAPMRLKLQDLKGRVSATLARGAGR